MSSQAPSERFQEQQRVSPRPAQPVEPEVWNSRNVTALKPSHETTTSRSPTHSRDSSLSKISTSGYLTNAALSPRFPPSRTRAESGDTDNFVEPKSMPYGHHRQTSIVHGIQHSRNGSIASSSSSPLSPVRITPGGGPGPDAFNMARAENDISLASPLSSLSGNSSFSSTATLIPDRVPTAPENSANAASQKRLERMHSRGSRREPAHHHSHSRHYHEERVKNVSEYALHVLFTSVSIIS